MYQTKAKLVLFFTEMMNELDKFKRNLLQSEPGHEIVEEYYNVAPGLVMMIDMQKDADQIYQNIYEEYLTPCIQHIENERNEECCKLYMQMVNNLKKQYLYS